MSNREINDQIKEAIKMKSLKVCEEAFDKLEQLQIKIGSIQGKPISKKEVTEEAIEKYLKWLRIEAIIDERISNAIEDNNHRGADELHSIKELLE